MIFILDNYDSFTYNIVQRLGEIDPTVEIEVHRNDQITVDEIAAKRPSHIIISPGPCTPTEAGISCEVARKLSPRFPLLGVCLGHQSIAEAFGGEVVRADQLMHGKTDQIHHANHGLYEGLPNPFTATRYHSLIVRPGTLGEEFEICAWCEGPGGQQEIMGLQHRQLPLFGMQFHPESFLTEPGTELLRRFMAVPAPSSAG